MLHVFGLVALVFPLLGQVPGKVDTLQTVAERSDYRATARYDDVAAWCRDFAKATPNAYLTELGRSSEGRSIPLLIVADPPVKTAAEAASSGKLVCLIIGNIHAGEVCGKEALPMLLRDVFGVPHPASLEGPDPRGGADLQHRRQRAGLENEPAGPGWPRGRNGPAGQRPRARLEPRLHQAGSPRDPRAGAVLERMEPSSLHRYAYDRWLLPPLHRHL